MVFLLVRIQYYTPVSRSVQSHAMRAITRYRVTNGEEKKRKEKRWKKTGMGKKLKEVSSLEVYARCRKRKY